LRLRTRDGERNTVGPVAGLRLPLCAVRSRVDQSLPQLRADRTRPDATGQGAVHARDRLRAAVALPGLQGGRLDAARRLDARRGHVTRKHSAPQCRTRETRSAPMKVRITYMVEVSDAWRRALRMHHGKTGVATRDEVVQHFRQNGLGFEYVNALADTIEAEERGQTQ
jgi:hypothetical protein